MLGVELLVSMGEVPVLFPAPKTITENLFSVKFLVKHPNLCNV